MEVREFVFDGIFEILDEDEIQSEEILFFINLIENPESELYKKLDRLLTKI
ncbi:hypothetical protein SAMN06265182_0542 [Persephonella hydrogeniphila]|uniref:Uncharacterized protein n=1 Tax=Persephonella hydrogeniphila TaxID=198703 RepID=A0A285N7V6_9AQUI|nr:hypothetical protein [Persephonella hydrogeniphila]SNZ04056.1 hypothetical protein SAMN06265182_0542 [Persephonella hydrogeniphila]